MKLLVDACLCVFIYETMLDTKKVPGMGQAAFVEYGVVPACSHFYRAGWGTWFFERPFFLPLILCRKVTAHIAHS